MTTKYTPGPWTINGDSQTLIGGGDGKQMLAQSLHGHVVKEWSRPLDEAQANAQLISAAPELLACCLEVRRLLENPEEWNDLTEIGFTTSLENAIAKATGEATNR